MPLGKAPHNSYGKILKSSSIIGGAQGVNYLIGMVRTKLVAMLLGPSGVGLVGLYISATSLVGAVAGLGIGSSGVREVAEAQGSGDASRVARTVKTLLRASWVTGLLGWILTIALAYPISLWTFGSGERTVAVALLGVTLLLGSISGGNTALLQGARRIGELARFSVISTLVGTIAAVALYSWLGERGIVPVLIATAFVNLGFSWWFARRVPVAPIAMTWTETWQHSKRFIRLGFAFMFGGVLTAVVTVAISSAIVRELGLEANGLYQAAWAISGMFAGFILGAMATDFYPRVTAVAHDHGQVNRLINEQTEIGILLALPGLLGTLAFAPWIVRIFYTAKFLPGAELLPWFVLGVFGQVISWPMGFAVVAQGAAGWCVALETSANLSRFLLSLALLQWLGLWGTALAIPLVYVVHTCLLIWICHRLTGFRWAAGSLKLLTTSAALVLAGFAAQKWLPDRFALVAGGVLTVAGCVLTSRGIATRLGGEHRIVLMVCKIPGVRFACGL